MDRLKYLEAEIEDLELKEKELDQQKLWLQQSIKNVKEDSTNKRYPLKHVLIYRKFLQMELFQQYTPEMEAGMMESSRKFLKWYLMVTTLGTFRWKVVYKYYY